VERREAGNDRTKELIYSLLLKRHPVKRDLPGLDYIMSMYSGGLAAKGLPRERGTRFLLSNSDLAG
jgi:hypothetical protein